MTFGIGPSVGPYLANHASGGIDGSVLAVIAMAGTIGAWTLATSMRRFVRGDTAQLRLCLGGRRRHLFDPSVAFWSALILPPLAAVHALSDMRAQIASTLTPGLARTLVGVGSMLLVVPWVASWAAWLAVLLVVIPMIAVGGAAWAGVHAAIQPWRRIAYCPDQACQDWQARPAFQCTSCGTNHGYVRPAGGRWVHIRCECGKKLRILPVGLPRHEQLKCNAGHPVNLDVVPSRTTTLALVGPPNSGKTTLILAMFAESSLRPGEHAVSLRPEDGAWGYRLRQRLDLAIQGVFPEQTQELTVNGVTFYASRKKGGRRIALFDLAGEAFHDEATMRQSKHITNASAFVVALDMNGIDPDSEDRSIVNDTIDAVDRLLGLLESARRTSLKRRAAARLAVVLTKCDLPHVRDVIGAAVRSRKRQEAQAWSEALGVSGQDHDEHDYLARFLTSTAYGPVLRRVENRFREHRLFAVQGFDPETDPGAYRPTGGLDVLEWVLQDV